MLQLFFAVAFSAVPLTLYVPPVRSLNLFVQTVEDILRQTALYTLRAYPRIRLGLSRIFHSIFHLSRYIECWLLNSSILMDEIGRMLGMFSSGPSLPWLWIIEYLSSFRQIDTSIIRGLIEAAPVLPDDLGENTREMIALRCLEELFGPTNGLRDVAPPDSRVVFDLAASCEDVLKHIVQEVSLSNLRKAGPELLRWDVHPFIRHKRASLPKCALEQLKDSILEETPVLDGDENTPTWRLDDSDDENGNREGNLIPQTHKDDNEVLQDGLLERNLIPIKRCKSDLVAGNLVGLVSCNQDGMHNDFLVNAKKFKQDATCTIQSVEKIPIPLHGVEQLDESGKIIKVTEIEGNNLGKDSQAGEGDEDVFVVSRTLGQSDAVGHVELQDNEMENAQNADIMGEQKYGYRPSKNVMMDESNHVENGALEKSPGGDASENFDQGFPLYSLNSTSAVGLQQNIEPDEAKADMEHPCAEKMCEYVDERFNIALNKSLFLSSQCIPSQDPLGKSGWTEQKFCVKCNKNGQVLVCSSSGCPLVVHESCLGSPARFDDKGNFYCPFCVCSVSITKYLEAKDKTSLARKELDAFLEHCSKKLTEQQWKLQSHLRLNVDEDLVGIQMNGHLGESKHKFISQKREVKCGPSASCLDDKLCVEEKFVGGAVRVQGEKNEEQEKLVHGQQSMREHEHQQDQLPDNRKCSDDNPAGENTKTIPENQVEVGGKNVKEAVQPQITNPPQKPVCAFNGDGEESPTAANDKFIVSSYSIRLRKRETKCTFPPIPQLRRKKLPWTKNEEEMLRREVEKYASHGGTVPWKKILDMGTSVFLSGRTTVDLKDKWRNMCKGGPSM
ncbi:PREDICTED: uncharacterized protein LOC18599003 isoform X1 [Theobroma cacao]|uniref:Uncharacterized protein LOC18599003 isoform X1 n=2 Tax=Theobroma cacao TaxID=3641 RepID=A0AB32V4Z9_THECC|nr:PREDICTED: uncharacterized protein LOC18599003 isoform X1 [Theobroma cacao]